jgi:hypothetical protein
MKTIKFSDEEITFLRQQYTDELAQAEKYIDQIKDVLKKLGTPARVSKEVLMEKEPKVAKRRGPKPKVKAIEAKVPKKRGRPKRVVVPTTAEAATVTVAKPVKKEVKKKVGPKPKKKIATKAKVKIEKKVISKPAPNKKAEEKAEVVPTTLPTSNPKEIKKVVKKWSNKKRRPKRISLVNLRRPLPKKEPEVKPEPESEPVPMVEPIVTTTEKPKE